LLFNALDTEEKLRLSFCAISLIVTVVID
jgi:hypothetical protein